MTSTFTPNINLEEPARGDQVGTWDTPVNSNMTVIDLVAGAIATQALTNANIILSGSQFQSRQLTFSGALSGSVTITFPTSFKKAYDIYNTCTGSSAFTITLGTTASGGQAICCPPGQMIEVVNDGTNLVFKNLPPVGTYMDFATSTVPAWISGCTVPPWLNCIGGTFNATTYPALNAFLGNNSLPDRRGRVGITLDAGAGRLTNFSGLLNGGGDQNLQGHVHSGATGGQSNDHTHSYVIGNPIATTTGGGAFALNSLSNANAATGGVSADHSHNFTTATTGAGNGQNVQPSLLMGITMIRAG